MPAEAQHHISATPLDSNQGEGHRLELLEAVREVGATYVTAGTLVETGAVQMMEALAAFPCPAVRRLAAVALHSWRRTALVHVHSLTGARRPLHNQQRTGSNTTA